MGDEKKLHVASNTRVRNNKAYFDWIELRGERLKYSVTFREKYKAEIHKIDGLYRLQTPILGHWITGKTKSEAVKLWEISVVGYYIQTRGDEENPWPNWAKCKEGLSKLLEGSNNERDQKREDS